MAGKASLTSKHIRRVLSGESVEEIEQGLALDTSQRPPRFPAGASVGDESVARRRNYLEKFTEGRAHDLPMQGNAQAWSGNIENLVGTVSLPVGVAGPLRVRGLFARGDYPVPLATTEAALVASYHRGASLVTAAGGCRSFLLYESVSRAPAFAFRSLVELGKFVLWASESIEEFRRVASETTRHGELVDMGVAVEGNHVYLDFEFTTGDAAGQNMVTIATQAIFDYILDRSPVAPSEAYVEGNYSGDKKASAQSFTSVRGKKVTAECIISAELIQKRLHTTPQGMVDYWKMSALGGVLSGTVGVQGHYANGLAALSLATGQDVACVAESAVGVTRMELVDDGSLYTSVTLPNLIFGTVGGGTGLPDQSRWLSLMDLAGVGKSAALAEVCGALLLAGELSIIGAMASGDFTKAHRRLAREKSGATHSTDQE
ncbi:MAG: hydroxymethylglutaryl-CoA reductase [Verrucomicrobiota bacterium]